MSKKGFAEQDAVMITFIINSLSMGGAESVLAKMANYWVERSKAVTVLTFDDGRNVPFCALDRGIRHLPLGVGTKDVSHWSKPRKLLMAVPKLRKAIKQSDPDVVISFMDQANLLTLLATAGLDVPVIVSERVNPARSSIMELNKGSLVKKFYAWFRNRLYARASKVIVQTESSANYFPPAMRRLIAVIPNPVTFASAEKADVKIPRRSIVGMGRFAIQKRFDLLINAFSKVAERHKDWHLVLVGDGALKVDLGSLANKLRLSDRVTFPGPTKTPLALLAQAEIFVLCSDYEGFPGTLCEAMACGTAVIATDCLYGPAELISPDVNGILVPVNDVESLAVALDALIADPDKRIKLAVNGPQTVKRYDIDRVMNMWNKVIVECFALRG